MRKKIRYLTIYIMLVIFITNFSNIVLAADVSVSTSSVTLYVGETKTITIDGSGVAGNISVSISDSSIASVSSLSSDWLDGSSATFVVKAVAVGTTRVNVNGTVANLENSDDESDISKVINVVVKKKETDNGNSGSEKTTYTKSQDATLKSLKLDIEGMEPMFSSDVYTYTLNVGTELNDIIVNASPSSNKASVNVSGNTVLEEGTNTILVTVTAEAGNQKVYKILVTKSSDPVKSNAYLKNIIIENIKLNEDFIKENFTYTLPDINVKDKALNISAFPENENATYVISGNENFVIGENVIRIQVTAEDGKTQIEYTLTFNATEDAISVISNNVVVVNEDKGNTVESNASKIIENVSSNFETQLLLIVYALAIIEFIEIVYLYSKLKKVNSNSESKSRRAK